MSVRYIGQNEAFAKQVQSVLCENTSLAEAVKTGKFRNADKANRTRFPLTAALLDRYCAPYSKRLTKFHYRVLLKVIHSGVELSTEDKD